MILSLVERGWQAARVCSLEAEPHGVRVLHVVKGRLDRSVLALIEPKPHIRLVSLPKNFFWPVVFPLMAWCAAISRLRVVVVDNERSARRLAGWARALWVRLMIIQWHAGGYELREHGRVVDRASCFPGLRPRCASR